MMQVLVCILVLGSMIQYCNSDETLGKVVFANVLYRHGDRTPLEPYPNDPYKSELFWPVPFGQLTNLGNRQQLTLGKWLRDRYSHLLSSEYSVHDIYVLSADDDVTLMSATANLAGMYPSFGNQERMPIPVHSLSKKEDNLLAGTKHCERYSRELQRAQISREMWKIHERSEELLDYLREMSGMDINSIWDIELLYDILHVQELHNKTLPEWTKSAYPSMMKPLVKKKFEILAYNKIMQRLKSGPLLKDMIEHLELKSMNALTKKLWMYSAHDYTIANMLMTLGLSHCPSYASTLLIELRLDAQKNYVVTIFYKNSTEEPTLLTLPGCGVACPLYEFVRLTKDVIPHNWEHECSLEYEDYVSDDHVSELSDKYLKAFEAVTIALGVSLLILHLLLFIGSQMEYHRTTNNDEKNRESLLRTVFIDKKYKKRKSYKQLENQ